MVQQWEFSSPHSSDSVFPGDQKESYERELSEARVKGRNLELIKNQYCLSGSEEEAQPLALCFLL